MGKSPKAIKEVILTIRNFTQAVQEGRKSLVAEIALFTASTVSFTGCISPSIEEETVVREEAEKKSYNILWLDGDDMSIDLSCYGRNNGIETPNIDRLATEGVVFTNFLPQMLNALPPGLRCIQGCILFLQEPSI
jgi:hypothetical protein